MINLQTEQLLTLGDAAKLCPGRGGKHPHLATLHRWASNGVGPSGAKVTLETLKVGGIRVTSREAITRFILFRMPAGAVLHFVSSIACASQNLLITAG